MLPPPKVILLLAGTAAACLLAGMAVVTGRAPFTLAAGATGFAVSGVLFFRGPPQDLRRLRQPPLRNTTPAFPRALNACTRRRTPRMTAFAVVVR